MSHKKAINNVHDRSYKDLYSNKIVFLNLVKDMLKAPWANDLKEDNLILVDKEYILSDYEENEADIVYFLLDQKVDPLEFFNRLKVVALEFNNLTDEQRMILKHWIRNTVDETIAGNAIEILESRKEEVESIEEVEKYF